MDVDKSTLRAYPIAKLTCGCAPTSPANYLIYLVWLVPDSDQWVAVTRVGWSTGGYHSSTPCLQTDYL